MKKKLMTILLAAVMTMSMVTGCAGQSAAEPAEVTEEAQEAALTIARAMAAKTKAAPKKTGKQTFCYQTLESLRQEGSEVPETATDGDGLISEFGFWGGEFGNWLNNEERQKNLDMSRISFTNIAAALCIDSKAVSFGGKLSIAFGARGKIRSGRGGAGRGGTSADKEVLY